MVKLVTEEEIWGLIYLLDSPEGCNVRYGAAGIMTWDCDHTLTLTRRWLKRGNFDVEASLALFRSMGATCDCEVLWNVPPAFDREKVTSTSQASTEVDPC
jgi:hypothetical protein